MKKEIMDNQKLFRIKIQWKTRGRPSKIEIILSEYVQYMFEEKIDMKKALEHYAKYWTITLPTKQSE